MSEKEKKEYLLKNGSVAKQVADILTSQIVKGEFAEGDFLPTEEVLCSDFGIGRSSVREAIKTLESRGLVRKIQGRGVEVIDESIEATSEMLSICLSYRKATLKDLMDFRVSLEMQNVELAARNATDEDIEHMAEIIEKMNGESGDMDDFAAYDFEFHEAIAKASGNRMSLIIVGALKPILYKQIVYTIDPNFNPEKSNHFHEHIFEAIRDRKPETAIKAMHAHLFETQRIITELDLQGGYEKP